MITNEYMQGFNIFALNKAESIVSSALYLGALVSSAFIEPIGEAYKAVLTNPFSGDFATFLGVALVGGLVASTLPTIARNWGMLNSYNAWRVYFFDEDAKKTDKTRIALIAIRSNRIHGLIQDRGMIRRRW